MSSSLARAWPGSRRRSTRGARTSRRSCSRMPSSAGRSPMPSASRTIRASRARRAHGHAEDRRDPELHLRGKGRHHHLRHGAPQAAAQGRAEVQRSRRPLLRALRRPHVSGQDHRRHGRRQRCRRRRELPDEVRERALSDSSLRAAGRQDLTGQALRQSEGQSPARD